MSVSNQAMKILELPSEIIEKILDFVPDHQSVALTCRTFYEISCQIRCYKTTIRRSNSKGDSPGISIMELEQNESLLQSIKSSKRKIIAIELCSIRVPVLKIEILKMLFERFGRRLSELTITNCGTSVKHFIHGRNSPKGVQLDMPNLKELTIQICPLEVLEVFNHLPDNVLKKVVVKECNGNVENALKNQRNIKELTWFSCHLTINTRNLQLLSLKLDKVSYSKELLTDQGSLTSITLPFELKQPDIDTISTLENLEHLKFKTIQFLNLSALRNLTKLKKLVVIDGVESVQTLKSQSVIDLTLRNLTIDFLEHPDFAVILSTNCPNIRKLEITYDKIGYVLAGKKPAAIRLNSFLDQYQNLESFSTTLPSDFTSPKDFTHRNLKQLTLNLDVTTPVFKNLLKGCVALETLKIDRIDWKLLKTILTARPNLKDLCVACVKNFNEKFISTFWTFGGNLGSFHVKGISAKQLEKQMTMGKMQEFEGGLPYLALMKAFGAKKSCC